MKKIVLAVLLWPLLALAQTYPSPTFNNLTVNGTATFNSTPTFTAPLAVSSGGTASGTASGTALDNITGFSATGFITRTGAGAYAFQSLANGITYGNLAQAAANTVLANATGATANLAAFAMPSCSATGNALTWTSGTGFTCGTGFAPLASPTFTGTVTIPAGASISGYLTTASAASTYAPLASPALTGTPTAPTATAGTSTTQVATTAFVGGAISGMSTSTFGALYLAWFNSLPTTLPASAGVLWNNGGVLSKS